MEGASSGRYAETSEEELLRLGRSYDDLTEDAQREIRGEFARRGLEAPLMEDEDGEPDWRVMVTVAQYRDLSEGIVARSLLESAGIGALLQDENLVRLDWQVSNFIGGMRLQVELTDEAVARELLTAPVAETIATGPEPFAQPHCPVCNSLEITFEGASRGAAIASLFLFSVPLPTGAKTWHCAVCGSRWEDHEQEGLNAPVG